MTLQELLINYVWDNKIEVQFRESSVSTVSKAVYAGKPEYLPHKLDLREVLGIYSYNNTLIICVKADKEEISE